MDRRMNTYAKELTFDQLADVNGGKMAKKVYEDMRSKILKSDLSIDDKNKAIHLLNELSSKPDQNYSEEFVNKIFNLHYGI